MSFKRKFYKNIATLASYNFGSQILNFLSSIVLSRLLLPEEYGYVALIIVFTGFVVLFSDAGLSFSIIRSDYGRTYQRAISNLSFYIGVFLFLLMILLAFPIAKFYRDPSLVMPTIVISFTFVISSLYIAPQAIITKNLNFNYLGQVKFMANVISIFFMILFAYLGFSYWSLIIPQLILAFYTLIMTERKVKLGFKFYKLSYAIVAFKKTKSLIFNLSGFNLINYWARNSDNLIIGRFYSSYDLGIYNRAYKMLQLSLNMLTGLFGTVLYPSLKKLQSEGQDYRPEYQSILGIISLISFPVGAILISIPDIFVRVLWGENWLMVADFLPYFGLLILFQTLISSMGQIFILLKQERMMFILGVISAVIMIAAIVIGAYQSVLMIAIYYSFSYLLFIVPLNIYLGFYRSYKFSVRYIMSFWLPKIILGNSLLVALVNENQLWAIIILGFYFLHLLLIERGQIFQINKIILNFIKRDK